MNSDAYGNRHHRLAALLAAATATFTLAQFAQAVANAPSADRFVVVDCLLPGQVRKLGGQMTYLSPRRPTRATTSECEIRGGEYVAYDRANYATSLQVWMPKAKEGDAQAQTYVGQIFEKGMGQPPDPATAAIWYQKAADQGFALAQSNLAYLYEKGNGVAADPLKALNLYRQSAGITGDSLTFASEVTAAKAEAQTTIDQLTAQLEQQTAQAETLRAELLDSQKQVEQRKAALLATRREAVSLKQKLAAAQNGDSSTAGPRAAQLHEIESALKTREAQVAQQQAELETLQKSNAERQTQLDARLADASARDAALQKELGSKKSDSAALRGQLAAAQERLSATSQRVEELNSELASYKQSADRLAAQQKAESAGNHADSERTRQAVAEREQQIAQQSALIAQLQSQKKSYDDALARLKTQSTSDSASVRAQLAAAEDQLAATNRRVAELTQSLATQRDSIGKDRERLTKDAKTASATTQAETERLRSTLSERQAQLDQQTSAIAALEAQRKALDAQVSALKTQSSSQEAAQKQQTQEVQAVRAELASTQQRYLESQQKLTEANGSFETLRSQIAADREQATRARASASAEQKQAVENLAQEVAKREQLLIEQRAQIAALTAESREYAEQIDRLRPAAAQIAMRGAQTDTGGQLSSTPPLHAPVALPKGLALGNYHALIIGNNTYQHMPNLETAVNDARAVARVLKDRYGFQVRVLENSTRAEIMSALNDYRVALKDTDNLLIYYAGHGELDSKNLRGYWLPVNANRDDATEWISDQMITDQIGLMAARHVLVIADSCYSGAMTRSAGARLISKGSEDAENSRLIVLAKLPSRTVLTSGGEKPVLDGGGGNNSIFAHALVDILGHNDHVLEGTALWNQLFDPVKRAAARFKVEQSPRYAELPDAGHMNGEFLFVPRVG